MNIRLDLERKVTVVIKKLGRRRVWGLAYHDTGVIEIDPRATGRKFLEVLNHESLHILLPYLSEEEITRVGAELTRVVWDQQFRRYDNDASQKLQDEEE